MSVSFAIISLIILLALPAFAQWRIPNRPEAIMTLAAFGLVGAGLTVDVLFCRSVSLSQASNIGNHDTYYITSHAPQFLWISAFFITIAAILWVQWRWLSHPVGWATTLCCWLLILNGAAIVIRPILSSMIGSPRRYTEHADHWVTLAHIDSLAALVGQIGFFGLLVLFIWAVIARLRGSSLH